MSKSQSICCIICKQTGFGVSLCEVDFTESKLPVCMKCGPSEAFEKMINVAKEQLALKEGLGICTLCQDVGNFELFRLGEYEHTFHFCPPCQERTNFQDNLQELQTRLKESIEYNKEIRIFVKGMIFQRLIIEKLALSKEKTNMENFDILEKEISLEYAKLTEDTLFIYLKAFQCYKSKNQNF